MVKFEILSELVEEIANMLGIYGIGPEDGDHPDDCKCRMCFVSTMEDRIRDAVENEKYLKMR